MRCVLVLLALSFALPVWAEPGYFRVVGVASDDTLNVRAEPRASSADIGDLEFNATGVEVIATDASGTWGRIVWQEGNGWVAMRFLQPDPVAQIAGTRLPAGLTCTGTEPFWSLKLSGTSGVYSDLNGAAFAMSLQGARVAEGRAGFPVQLGLAGGGAASTALIRPTLCGDGMSDRDYPWSVDLILNTASGGRYMVGCCQLPLDAGSH